MEELNDIKNDISISVVVSIYNIEQYINECVDSIITQSYKPHEIILVDDGSRDRSKDICDSYKATKDINIIVIHQKNKGLSGARNTGLLNATGEYVYFVDGDDYIEKETLSHFVSLINKYGKVDCIYGRMKQFEDGTRNFVNDDFYIENKDVFHKNGKDVFVEAMKKYGYFKVGVRGLYNRSFLIDNELLFEEGITSEDTEWTPRVIVCSKTLIGSEDCDYCYRWKRKGSIMNTYSINGAKDDIYILNKWNEYSKQLNESEFKEQFNKELGRRYYQLFCDAKDSLKNEELRYFCELYDDNKQILKKHRPNSLKRAVVNVFLLIMPSYIWFSKNKIIHQK